MPGILLGLVLCASIVGLPLGFPLLILSTKFSTGMIERRQTAVVAQDRTPEEIPEFEKPIKVTSRKERISELFT